MVWCSCGVSLRLLHCFLVPFPLFQVLWIFLTLRSPIKQIKDNSWSLNAILGIFRGGTFSWAHCCRKCIPIKGPSGARVGRKHHFNAFFLEKEIGPFHINELIKSCYVLEHQILFSTLARWNTDFNKHQAFLKILLHKRYMLKYTLSNISSYSMTAEYHKVFQSRNL